MNNQLSARDLERVSAYLDNELSSGEKLDFEGRLKNEPGLSQALTDLRITRALLRRAPQRRVPRSFAVLRETILEKKPIMAGWTSFNLVSATAAFLLVVVFVGDIWANGLPLVSFGAPAAEEAPQALMAQEPSTEEPAAGDTVLAATPTTNPSGDIGEIERFAVPENEIGQKAPVTFDLRVFLADNARRLEFALAVVAIFAGGLAYWRRRNL
jgi:hypothetical protein